MKSMVEESKFTTGMPAAEAEHSGGDILPQTSGAVKQPVPAFAFADSHARIRALDPSMSFHLEAPAGSGKTFLLTARFLRLLGAVDHPQQILALTFTNKAAGEMRDRVGKYLRRAAAGNSPANELDAELLAAAARALDRHRNRRDLILGGELLRIQTFHSFCYALISQAPLEAGIAPGSTILVDPDQLYLLREVIDKTLISIMGKPTGDPLRSALENRLLYLNNSWPLLARELEELMHGRQALGELVGILDRQRTADYVYSSTQELVEAELSMLESAFQKTSPAHMWSDFLKDIECHNASLASVLPRKIPGSAWGDLAGWISISQALLTQAGEPRKKFGPATGFYSGFAKTVWAESIQTLDPSAVERLHRIRELPEEHAESSDFESLWDLVLLLNAVMKAYEERCRSQGLLDFAALETAALRLFDTTEPSDLQLLLDYRLQHILIDEFQDTNYQQWVLLQRLCTGWSADEGRTLFVVGDPKQSIYGFRKADVGLFLEAANGLPLDEFRKLPLEPLTLSTNFRSMPHLIEWCNNLFGRTIMADPRPDLDEVPFKGSTAAPGTETDTEPEACLAQIPELSLFIGHPDALSAREREANRLARHISESVKDQGGEPEIGILLFTRTHLPVYLEALQRYGVSVQVTEGLKLLERPEVKYLWQLCRALVFPHDHPAWAAQLRSPWLSLSYQDIYAVFLEEPAPWIEKIQSFARRDERVAQFWEALQGARLHLGHEPLADVIEDTWLALGGARLAPKRWGSRGLACSRRFFELLRQAEVYEPVQTLMRVEQLLEDTFEPVDPDSAQSKVSIMTVHRAKGLEFDTVYVPFMDWSPTVRERSNQPPYLLERVPGSSERYLLAAKPDRRRGEPDPVYRWLHRLQVDRRWGEAKRLFYVAATRARSRLYMSGVLPWRHSKGLPTFPTQTPLSWLNAHYSLADALDFQNPTAGEEIQDLCSEAYMTMWGRVLPVQDPELQVNIEPPVSSASQPFLEESPGVVVSPAPFERERPLFQVRTPSAFRALTQETAPPPLNQIISGSTDSILYGTLVHRLLESYGKQRRLPAVEGICGYLRRQGLNQDTACDMARSALDEVRECIEDPRLGRLYDLEAQDRYVEYPLESLHSSEIIYSGVIDLAVFDAGRWRLIDFKTSRPSMGEDLEGFLTDEAARYSPQLRAYREMWAKAKAIDENTIETVIYWTAFRRWETVT